MSSSLSNVGYAVILGAAGVGTAVGVFEGKTVKQRLIFGTVGAIAGSVAGYAAVQLISMIPSGLGSAVTSFEQWLSSPAAAYALATSNPISEAAASSTILNSISSQNPEYDNAVVVFSPQPYDMQQFIAASQQKGNIPIINATPQGIGTYAPAPPPSTLGSQQNPYLYSSGYQGPGWYKSIPNLASGLIVYFASLSQYNNPLATLNGAIA